MLSVGEVQYAVSSLTVFTHSMPRRAAAVARIRLYAPDHLLVTLSSLLATGASLPPSRPANVRLDTTIHVCITGTYPDRDLRLNNEYERGTTKVTEMSLPWYVRCCASTLSIGRPSVSLHRL